MIKHWQYFRIRLNSRACRVRIELIVELTAQALANTTKYNIGTWTWLYIYKVCNTAFRRHTTRL